MNCTKENWLGLLTTTVGLAIPSFILHITFWSTIHFHMIIYGGRCAAALATLEFSRLFRGPMVGLSG